MGKKATVPPAPRPHPLQLRRQQDALSRERLWKVLAAPLAALGFAALAYPVLGWWRRPTAYRRTLVIPRLNASDPDVMVRFFERYHGKAPVVIEGALDAWPAMRWTAASLAASCPSARVPVYNYDLSATDWAALKDAGDMPLGAFLQQEFEHGGVRREGSLYGLEMSLRSECPSLLEDVRIPAFFSDDLLVRYYKKGSWPTLLVGPQGTQSGLHRDTHDLPFWMAIFAGRKKWRIFADDEPALQELFIQERNGFGFNPFEPDFAQHPALSRASVYDHTLEAGQLLYIPNGAPHAAYNLDDTIAISGNYLDPQSLERHLSSTCKRSLWEQSPLCWRYEEEFAEHRALPLERLRELSYFEFTGAAGVGAWCQAFLPQVKDRAAKRPESERNVKIVEEYCALKSKD